MVGQHIVQKGGHGHPFLNYGQYAGQQGVGFTTDVSLFAVHGFVAVQEEVFIAFLHPQASGCVPFPFIRDGTECYLLYQNGAAAFFFPAQAFKQVFLLSHNFLNVGEYSFSGSLSWHATGQCISYGGASRPALPHARHPCNVGSKTSPSYLVYGSPYGRIGTDA